jgi:hypothetical protein
MSNSDLRPDADAEWNALLHQLRQRPEAQPRPFFYARVQARLAAGRGPAAAWLPAWVRRPAYAALLSALVLAVSGDGPALRPAAPATPYGLSQPTQLTPP